ncbi:hypothetical protein CQW23_09798 [Capsicum baccatum]|uniref:Uncharacterized protein n=1 Tax=Capsicum baccatum TaxID=33114 RepID=A0A2G2WXX4_CAPBA|nr:hypothetical protein CQW23_09798 [Capsicum baccatum]
MKHPKDMDVFSVANVHYEDEKALSVEKQLTVEPLSAVLLNFKHEEVEEYEETVCALAGIRSYYHAPKELDLDLKNQPSPTVKTSIAETPVLEFKGKLHRRGKAALEAYGLNVMHGEVVPGKSSIFKYLGVQQ